jgi:hypothetical protein
MVKKDTWEHILRQVSHIEALFFQNQKSTYYNARLTSTRINQKEEAEEAIDGLNVIRWEWRGLYLGNVS